MSSRRFCDFYIKERKRCWWTIHPPFLFDKFYFIPKSDELSVSEFARKTITKFPKEPFCPDKAPLISHYLFVRFLAGVFPLVAHVIGGIPWSPCQDQLHWLRKLVKISLLSMKPLLYGYFSALYFNIVQIYNLGPDYGLLKHDIDPLNKADQRSAEIRV